MTSLINVTLSKLPPALLYYLLYLLSTIPVLPFLLNHFIQTFVAYSSSQSCLSRAPPSCKDQYSSLSPHFNCFIYQQGHRWPLLSTETLFPFLASRQYSLVAPLAYLSVFLNPRCCCFQLFSYLWTLNTEISKGSGLRSLLFLYLFARWSHVVSRLPVPSLCSHLPDLYSQMEPTYHLLNSLTNITQPNWTVSSP